MTGSPALRCGVGPHRSRVAVVLWYGSTHGRQLFGRSAALVQAGGWVVGRSSEDGPG